MKFATKYPAPISSCSEFCTCGKIGEPRYSHASSNNVPTPWGDITGAGVTLTFGYRAAGPSVQFGPVLESVSPLYGLYTDTAAGSLSLTPSARKCTLGTLNGMYIFQLNGSVQAQNGWMPYTESGSFLADGKGNILVLDSGNIAGTVFTSRVFPIVYTLNDGCLGTFSFGTSGMDVQVSLDGKPKDTPENSDDKPVHMDEVLVEIAAKNTMPEFTENLRGASP